VAPFGFTPPGDSDDSENSENGMPDFSALFEQLGISPENLKDFTNLGFLSSANSNSSASEFTFPIGITRDIAKKFVSAKGSLPIGTTDLSQIHDAMEIAELWLNEATVFPASSSAKNVMTRNDWVDSTMAGWQLTVEPLALGLAQALSSVIEGQEMPEDSMPLEAVAGLLRGFIATMIATQLGQCVGGLAESVTGAHDVGLPLLNPSRPALLPQNIAQWSVDIGVPESEIRIFHALREGAVARLFDSNPWLVDYMRMAIADYGKGIHIDVEKMQQQAQEAMESGAIDPDNPETLTLALNQGLFTPEESPQQGAALAKLETALALIDGWADDVTTLAAADRLPSLNSLRETLRRRRATSSPAQQLFSSLFGLEVSPRMAREASAFWLAIRELRDVAARDQIWSGILPTHEELNDPATYLSSVEIPDDLSGLAGI
jgi:putative hydrolase